jgi:hypothetical protein
MHTFKSSFLGLFKLLFLPSLALFFSCSARIDGVVTGGGAAEISVRASLGPRTVGLVQSLRGFMGDNRNTPILNSEAINRSLAAASGIRSVSLKNAGPEALEGAITISNVGDFLLNEKGMFITYNEGADSSSIVVVLDRNSAPLLISRLSPEVEEYLSALMAPVALGEYMSAEEYLSIVAMVYGRPLADEIAAARIRAAIEFPRQVASVTGGSSSGRRAEFDIPLLDVLVLEKPLRYEVNW